MERDFTVDIQSFRTTDEEASPDPISCGKLESASPPKMCNELVSVNWSVKAGKGENCGGNAEYGDKVCPENMQVLIEIDKRVEGVVDMDPVEKKIKKDKRKSVSAKKPPKPPRPPTRLSLDAADQKLIKELAELAMLKRARIERMKALKKMKAANGSPLLSSSGGSFFAMLLTVLFCIVIICQASTEITEPQQDATFRFAASHEVAGMSSKVNTAISFNSSLVSAEAMESSFIAVENHTSLSRNDSNSTPPGSS